MSQRDARLPFAEVIGCPIAHSRSPAIHGFWLAELGIAAGYRTAHVMPAELATYFAARRFDPAWRGCNVTIPHKESAALMVDVLDARAAAVGATNTILRGEDGSLLGTNTDVDGVGEAIAAVDLSRGSVVVLGSGGAARAAFAYLARAGASVPMVRVMARDAAKARSATQACGLDAQIVPFTVGTGALGGAALLINATQLGMTGQAPIPGFVIDALATMAPGARVFDMVYAPLVTELLAAADAAGLACVDGLTMLIGQAATAFTHFFGCPPPRTRDTDLRALLTA